MNNESSKQMQSLNYEPIIPKINKFVYRNIINTSLNKSFCLIITDLNKIYYNIYILKFFICNILLPFWICHHELLFQ